MTNIDIVGYLSSRGIPYSTEGKNVQQGWVGTACPFCNDTSNHLGIKDGGGINCWRCGTTGNVKDYLFAVEGSWNRVNQILSEFSTVEYGRVFQPGAERTTAFHPPNTQDFINPKAARYLRERGYAYKYIEKLYGVKTFHPTAKYKFRLYIPITIQNRVVSFTTRSYVTTTKAPKYLHLPKESSVLFAKETLYNSDQASDTIVVVEGPLDAWRIGSGAVALYGVIYTAKQLSLLRRYKRVFVMFDAEPQAQEQADKLAYELSGYNLEAHVIRLESGDPGEMKLDDVRHLRREIFGH